MTIQLRKYAVFLLSALLVVAMLAACNTTTPDPAAENGAAEVEMITLERQPCFGFCPTYTVTVHGDGTVEYDGMENVEVSGAQTANVDAAAVQALGQEMIAAGYLEWEDSYMNQDVTDNPYVITSLTLSDGTTKRIEHYYGDFSAPEALTELESRIDQTANTAQWVGTTE